MSATRITFTDILTHEFHDAQLKTKCLQASKDILRKHNNDLITRIFDTYPCFLPPYKIHSLRTRFAKILQKVSQPNTELPMFFLNEEIFQELFHWVKEIAEIGCVQLFETEMILEEKEPKLKSSIVHLLEWSEFVDNIHANDILCAYIGAVSQHVLRELADLIADHLDAFTTICGHFNKNLRCWVNMAIKNVGYIVIENEDVVSTVEILHPSKLPKLAMLAGLFITGGLVMHSIFKKNESSPIAALETVSSIETPHL